jgi:hypothetical protein
VAAQGFVIRAPPFGRYRAALGHDVGSQRGLRDRLAVHVVNDVT